MRFILLILFGTICFSASAQWYRIDLKLKKHIRPDAIEPFADQSIARLPKTTVNPNHKINLPILNRTEYSYYAAEAIVMKTAQRNMRFRVYNDASYNFSDLAHLYILQDHHLYRLFSIIFLSKYKFPSIPPSQGLCLVQTLY